MNPLLFLLLSLVSLSAFAQDYDSERTVLANFLKRMYNQTQFEGVKIVEDYDSQYFISVLTLDKSKYKTNSAMMRVAQVKALWQASEYVLQQQRISAYRDVAVEYARNRPKTVYRTLIIW